MAIDDQMAAPTACTPDLAASWAVKLVTAAALGAVTVDSNATLQHKGFGFSTDWIEQVHRRVTVCSTCVV
jgi:hypothetical protein